MRYKTVIWDLNGTLLSDMELSISAMNTVLGRRDLEKIPNLKAFRDVFGFPVEDYYARLGFDFSLAESMICEIPAFFRSVSASLAPLQRGQSNISLL